MGWEPCGDQWHYILDATYISTHLQKQGDFCGRFWYQNTESNPNGTIDRRSITLCGAIRCSLQCFSIICHENCLQSRSNLPQLPEQGTHTNKSVEKPVCEKNKSVVIFREMSFNIFFIPDQFWGTFVPSSCWTKLESVQAVASSPLFPPQFCSYGLWIILSHRHDFWVFQMYFIEFF